GVGEGGEEGEDQLEERQRRGDGEVEDADAFGVDGDLQRGVLDGVREEEHGAEGGEAEEERQRGGGREGGRQARERHAAQARPRGRAQRGGGVLQARVEVRPR